GDVECFLPPLQPGVFPVSVPLVFRTRLYEKLHFHLLKLAVTKDEIAHDDLVAERATHLRNPERQFFPHGLLDVAILHKHCPGGLGTQIRERALIFYRSDARLEQEVKLTRFSHGAALSAIGAGIRGELVGTKTMMAIPTLDQRI